MRRVAFLPQKLCRPQERARDLLPAHDVRPLVDEHGQIAPRLDPLGVERADDRFRRRPDNERLGELFVTALGHPGDLRRKALDVLLLLHQEARRNEERKVRVDVSRRFDAAIEPLLNQLPDGIAVRTNRHASLDLGVIGELGAPHDIEIPAGKVLRLRRDLGDLGLFLVIGHCQIVSEILLSGQISIFHPPVECRGRVRKSYPRGKRLRHSALPVYIVADGEIVAVMGAATLLASQCGAGDEAADGQDARDAPALCIKRKVVGHPGVERTPHRFELADDGFEAGPVPEQPDVAPHRPLEPARGIVDKLEPNCPTASWEWIRDGLDGDAVLQVGAHRASGTGAKHQPFEQRVAGKTVGAMHTSTGDLARREQSANRRASIEVGLHAAHDVVRGRAHRDPIARQIEARLAAGGGDQREALVYEVRVERLEREIDRRSRPPRLELDAARHPIARCEIARPDRSAP